MTTLGMEARAAVLMNLMMYVCLVPQRYADADCAQGVSNMGTRVSNLSVTDGTSGGGVSINSTTSANGNSYASASTSGGQS